LKGCQLHLKLLPSQYHTNLRMNSKGLHIVVYLKVYAYIFLQVGPYLTKYVFHSLAISIGSRAGVSNSTCSEGHMRTYKVTCRPHYNADATTAVCELTRISFCIFISCRRYQIIDKSFLAVYVSINHF